MRLSPDERRIIEEYIDAEIFNINGLINVIENNCIFHLNSVPSPTGRHAVPA